MLSFKTLRCMFKKMRRYIFEPGISCFWRCSKTDMRISAFSSFCLGQWRSHKQTHMLVQKYIFYYIFKDWITYFYFVLIENSLILFSLEIWLDNMWVWVSRTNAGKQQAGDPNGKQNNIKLYNIWWFFILNLFNIFN